MQMLERFFITRMETSYCQMYALTKKQNNILIAFGIDRAYITEFIKQVNKNLDLNV